MIKTIFLGTAGSAPTKTRRMPSIAVIYGGDLLLFDCGEGTQFQMLANDLNPVRVKAIFLTHAHGDHTIGIAGLVRTMALQSRAEPLLIFVPAGYERTIRNLIAFDRAMITYPIVIRGIRSGTVYRGNGYVVNAFKVYHTIPTYGYVLRERDRLRFRKDVARKLRIHGTMFSEIQRKGRIKIGRRTVLLRQVAEKKYGKKIVYATDTRPTRTTLEVARNADLLIHESSYKNAEQNLARRRKHAASGEVALLAKRANVKKLVLTHISARHRTDAELLRDAKRVFRNTVVATDGYSVVI